jgi:hypothetical protein
MRRTFYFDFHVVFTLMQRSWNIVAGGVTVVFMPIWLSPVEQGYYFTFLSLLALQVFFELGFNGVVVQLVGHEVAHLIVDERGKMDGDPVRISRLNSLLTLLRRWYFTAATAFFGFISIAGYFFFRTKGGLPVSAWLGVWITSVFFTSINLYLSPQLAVFEGIGRVGQVARLRLIQSIVGFCIMWIAMSLGAGLKAVPISTAVAAMTSFWWLHSRDPFWKNSANVSEVGGHSMHWGREIFPLQWRIAVSWMSGYFIFQAFTPLIFAHQGAVEAGRIGIALTIFSSITALGMSWVNARAPKMAQYIARGERRELNFMFISVLRSSMIFTFAASLLLLLLVGVLRHFSLPAVGRIASLPILVCLALVAVANSFISGAAVYMRAHKKEPMLAPSVVGGLLALAAFYFGSRVNSLLPVVLYAILTVAVGLPWTVRLFLGYFRAVEKSPMVVPLA